jgi:epsilon-lactone hydrolase
MKTRSILWLIAIAATALTAQAADEPAAAPFVDADGTAHLPAGAVPASRFMSAEARAKFIKNFSHPPRPPAAGPAAPPDYNAIREGDERHNAPFVERARELYPVDIEERVLGGVRTQVVTPKGGVAPANRNRVLINLHGGGFIWGEGNGARVESIPIAGLGKIEVVTVAYRMAPEHEFPAAGEDVAAVYRELLKDHEARNIGIYGCSAGGRLTAQSIAWFDKEKLPMPGAIGTFCGSLAFGGGDSSHLAPLLVGELPAADVDSGSLKGTLYLKNAAATDPLVLPINSPRLLKRFPPTLLIAGSRDPTVSSLYAAQAALTEAGVEAELHVWDGMWHAFFFDPDLPESQQVYRVVVRFFDRHLGRGAAAAPRSHT